MAFTSPRTWVSGEDVTAALMNTHVRDNLKALTEFQSYTPTWTGATTNPVLGNGTKTGAYVQAGDVVDFYVSIAMGSTTTYGSGAWILTLPVAPASLRWMFTGTARDSSAGTTFPLSGEISGSLLLLRSFPTTAGNAFSNVTASVPMTWATSDELFVSGRYRAA